GGTDVMNIRLADGSETMLVADSSVRTVAWSPDGTRLFYWDQSPNRTPGLYSVAVDGSGARLEQRRSWDFDAYGSSDVSYRPMTPDDRHTLVSTDGVVRHFG